MQRYFKNRTTERRIRASEQHHKDVASEGETLIGLNADIGWQEPISRWTVWLKCSNRRCYSVNLLDFYHCTSYDKSAETFPLIHTTSRLQSHHRLSKPRTTLQPDKQAETSCVQFHQLFCGSVSLLEQLLRLQPESSVNELKLPKFRIKIKVDAICS